MHTATLLHDDVVDESDMRRGKVAARIRWGNEASVLVGDFLLGQAFRMMVEVGSLRALEILSAAACLIAEGRGHATRRRQEYRNERGRVSRHHPRQRRRSSSPPPARSGPVIAERPKAEIAACRSYGMNLGIAFQLIDDALDYGGAAANLGKNTGDDFREGKITLPVVLSFRRGSDEKPRLLPPAPSREGDIRDGDLEHAVAIMKACGALEDTVERARHYGAMARDALAIFPQGPMKDALIETVDFCVFAGALRGH